MTSCNCILFNCMVAGTTVICSRKSKNALQEDRMENDVNAATVEERPMLLPPGDNPLECRYCFREFNNRQRVIRHERIHTGEKPFKCNECQRQFADESTLRQHARVHSEVLLPCNDCGKSFRSRNGLKFHRCFVYLFNPRSSRQIDNDMSANSEQPLPTVTGKKYVICISRSEC